MPELLNILGCRYPIIQGPIGALNSPKLVAAICESGAFGMLALGFAQADETRRWVSEVQDLTDKPFGANIMIMNPANPEILEILSKAGVTTVTTSAGSPKHLYPLIHELGMQGLHVLLSLSTAIKAVGAGADGVVVSGLESGGLRSTSPESTTMILVPAVVDHVKAPVVAAGGIADSRGYRAALALGAQGVQIGTRFLVSEECPAPKAWKQTIIDATDGSTVLLPLGPMKMRVIPNPKLADLMKEANVDLTQEYNLMDAPKGWLNGDFDIFPAGSGQVCALINEIKPVKDIIEEMVSG